MTFEQFNKYQDDLLAKVSDMTDTKGMEYANSGSRFANFDRLAARLGIKNTTVGMVYLTKHMDAIESYISRGRTYSTETIQGRIVDAITYLTLIGGMIQEEGEPIQNVQTYNNNPDDEIAEYLKLRAEQVEKVTKPPLPENTIIWNCHYCLYKTENKSDLDAHEMWHSTK